MELEEAIVDRLRQVIDPETQQRFCALRSHPEAIRVQPELGARESAANMLQPLVHDRIPNISNIDPTFRDAAFDPGRRYSLPYMWGTTGIGVNVGKVQEILGEDAAQCAIKFIWLPGTHIGPNNTVWQVRADDCRVMGSETGDPLAFIACPLLLVRT